jgi:hypothetical protein
MADTVFPVASLDDALPHLRRPFAPAAVKWKIQTATNQNRAGIVVAHIDARLVIERLNLVAGGAWYDRYDQFAGAMRCSLWLYGQAREDVGLGSDQKAQVSDALKRAGVKYGIGVSVYALAQVYMEVGGGPNKLGTRKKYDRQKKEWVEVPDLRAENREWLADRYGAWLETPRGRGFGEPLEHGDELDAQGFDDEGAPTDLPEVEVASPEAEAEREAALERTRALAQEGS